MQEVSVEHGQQPEHGQVPELAICECESAVHLLEVQVRVVADHLDLANVDLSGSNDAILTLVLPSLSGADPSTMPCLW